MPTWRYLGGTPPFGCRVGEAGELIPMPEQQRALKRMRTLRAKGLALRAIADEMTAAGVQISHMGVKKALAAAGQQVFVRRSFTVWATDIVADPCRVSPHRDRLDAI